jgi:hypothetical protein
MILPIIVKSRLKNKKRKSYKYKNIYTINDKDK